MLKRQKSNKRKTQTLKTKKSDLDVLSEESRRGEKIRNLKE